MGVRKFSEVNRPVSNSKWLPAIMAVYFKELYELAAASNASV